MVKTVSGVMVGLYVQTLFTAVCGPSTTVGVQSRISAPVAVEDGGPQALEGYTTLAHNRGNTRLAFGVVGNVEMNARGTTTEIRSMQAGGVVTADGHVKEWVGLALSRPRAGEGYQGPVHIDRYDYIRFDNGWSIRPDGDKLLICDKAGVCRGL
jgi:hypothetical protein